MSEDPDRRDRKEQSARKIQPQVAGDRIAININGYDHEADANGEFDKHSDYQKTPTVHQSIFSGLEEGNK
jgi:hypothetical protein